MSKVRLHDVVPFARCFAVDCLLSDRLLVCCFCFIFPVDMFSKSLEDAEIPDGFAELDFDFEHDTANGVSQPYVCVCLFC